MPPGHCRNSNGSAAALPATAKSLFFRWPAGGLSVQSTSFVRWLTDKCRRSASALSGGREADRSSRRTGRHNGLAADCWILQALR